MKLPINVSESTKRRNPELFGLGKLAPKEPKPITPQTLESRTLKQQRRKSRMAINVHLIAVRRRLLDSDNAIGACKPLRDAIAESIGCDDADPRIRWHYGQIETKGKQGVIVKIEMI